MQSHDLNKKNYKITCEQLSFDNKRLNNSFTIFRQNIFRSCIYKKRFFVLKS